MFHKHGGDIYSYKDIRDFSANINFLGMPEGVRNAVLDSADQWRHYPDPQYRALRNALAERENTWMQEMGKSPIKSDQIICGNGAAELMFALAAARKPKKALLAVPSFFEYEQALSAFGCEIVYHLLKEEQEFVLDQSFLDAAYPDIDMVVLGNPNNPTGRLIDGDVLIQIIRYCMKNNIFLVLDESFFDFLSARDRARTFSGTVCCGQDPSLLVIKSFTKIYGMPGLRFGYGICSDQALLMGMRRVLQPWNVSVPAAAAALAASKELNFAKETAELTAKNREWMMEELRAAGFKVYPSNTNFLLFRGRADLGEKCLERGFLIRDCSNFPGLEKIEGPCSQTGTGLKADDGERYFRICIRSMEENQELLAALLSGQKTGVK